MSPTEKDFWYQFFISPRIHCASKQVIVLLSAGLPFSKMCEVILCLLEADKEASLFRCQKKTG